MSEFTLTIRIGTRLDEVEKLVILKTLQWTRGSKAEAAKTLGISLKTLRSKLKEYTAYRLDASNSAPQP